MNSFCVNAALGCSLIYCAYMMSATN